MTRDKYLIYVSFLNVQRSSQYNHYLNELFLFRSQTRQHVKNSRQLTRAFIYYNENIFKNGKYAENIYIFHDLILKIWQTKQNEMLKRNGKPPFETERLVKCISKVKSDKQSCALQSSWAYLPLVCLSFPFSV